MSLPPLGDSNAEIPARPPGNYLNRPGPIDGELLPDLLLSDDEFRGDLSPIRGLDSSPGGATAYADDDAFGGGLSPILGLDSSPVGAIPNADDASGGGAALPGLDDLETFTGFSAEEPEEPDDVFRVTTDVDPSTVDGGGVSQFNMDEFEDPTPTPTPKRASDAKAGGTERKKGRKGKKPDSFDGFPDDGKHLEMIKHLGKILASISATDLSQCTVLSMQNSQRKTVTEKLIADNMLKMPSYTRYTQNKLFSGISGKDSANSYFGGYDLNLKGLVETITGYPNHNTLDFILKDIKTRITQTPRENAEPLCRQLGIPLAYSSEMPVINTDRITAECSTNLRTVAAEFVRTVGAISYLIDVSMDNLVLVNDGKGVDHFRVRDNTKFRCPGDTEMSSFMPKTQSSLYKIVSASFKTLAGRSAIMAGVETFYMYEHYFTVLKTAIEFVTGNGIEFITDASRAEIEYRKLIGDPKQYMTDLAKLRQTYKKASPIPYLQNADYKAAKRVLDANALGDVTGLRHTALLTAAIKCGLGEEDITGKLRDLYQKSVGAYCIGSGREVPNMPLSMFVSFTDLCV